jgi:hypothetical protein
MQRLESETDSPLLQLPSFTEDFRWQVNAADLRGDAEPRPPRGLPRKLLRQLQTGRPLREPDVGAKRRGGLGDLQAEVGGRDGPHAHHRTGGQERQGEEEAGGRLLQLPESCGDHQGT